MPVIEHYERQGKLAKISAVPPPDEASTFHADAPLTCAAWAYLDGRGLSLNTAYRQCLVARALQTSTVCILRMWSVHWCNPRKMCRALDQWLEKQTGS